MNEAKEKGFARRRRLDWGIPRRPSRGLLATCPIGANPYTDYKGVKVQIREREEILLENFRRLPAETAKKLSALAQRLAVRAPGTTVDWSDSWSDADLREFTAALLKRPDDEEQKKPH